ncbi:hypothetical protein BKA62DRAFT_288256 [Auriculariales sp. MPI-PUGE-AT-0066]|nr:hypothetical protein BKA62DRAFT_288256 [Auriculariales sp. MPI-PUGE-AT-0066]
MDQTPASQSQTPPPDTKGKAREQDTVPTPSVDHATALSGVPATAPSAPTFKVFRPPTGPSTALRNLPDVELTPTSAEVVAAFQSQTRRTEALNNAPLRTKAMRDQEDKHKLARWPTTTIRVKFSDRTQLEKSFPSTDKIKAVYVFVRDCLADEVKPIKFVLYQSPPKRELKNSDPNVRDLSLAQLQLAPSSVLLLAFEDPSLNVSTLQAPLRPDILAQTIDLPPPPVFDTAPPKATGKTLKPSGSSGLTRDNKMPKWLKLPGGGKP